MKPRILTIKSFAGIGDLLMITPSLRVIREAYPDVRIRVNTIHGTILNGNPYISVDWGNSGTSPVYPDPKSGEIPSQHHSRTIWKDLCSHFDLVTKKPEIRPELYIKGKITSRDVLVQILHRNQWGGKKVAPIFLNERKFNSGFSSIPKMDNIKDLVRLIAGAPCVICAEGLISHIAAAVRTPAVVIYGGFLKPEWSGYEDQINLVNDIGCPSCYNTSPCTNNKLCFEGITIDMVLRAVEEARDKN